MRWLLGRTSSRYLAELASSRSLLAFDFDGTLAPLVARRQRARMRHRTSRLFDAICALYPCAVISGRARDDVRARLGAAPARHVIGNHGMEPGPDLDVHARRVVAIRAALEPALRQMHGVDVEDKRYSLAIHYRHAPSPRVARDRIDDALREVARDVRVVSGHQVVNVIPKHARDKGDVVADLYRSEGVEMVLYVGDDTTDEDVFALRRVPRLLSIRVGRTSTSAAGFYLRDQREIDVLLRSLVELRSHVT